MWVIFAAFFTYNITLSTGAMSRIKSMMSTLSGDRRIQALAIAWGFGGFLESAAGFGTAVIIPATILIALGFEPFFAAVICLLANTVPVAFGVIGIPITTLAKITELPVMPLSLNVVLQLTPFVLLVPFLIVLSVTKSLTGLKDVWLPTLVTGLCFAIPQFIIATKSVQTRYGLQLQTPVELVLAS
ncbi:L-lactate permease [Sporomusa ovata]|uniref:L-lactate permease n=1 Tax=Sporomusa ovata TaxID=2378 RepID=UPI001B7F967B|nr:L-lactate permease [Sporomusa ovata]